MEKLTFTVTEVAAQLNISKPLAYALCASKGFPSIRLGERRIVVPREAFMKWLEAQSSQGALRA